MLPDSEEIFITRLPFPSRCQRLLHTRIASKLLYPFLFALQKFKDGFHTLYNVSVDISAHQDISHSATAYDPGRTLLEIDIPSFLHFIAVFLIMSICNVRASAYKIKEKSGILGMVFREGAMKEEQSPPMMPPMTCFSVIRNPQIGRNKPYLLHEVIAMARGREDIERYGKAKEAWLRKFLSLEHGIPHHDVYRRVMSRIKPEEIERCFMNRARAVKKEYGREIIATGGKTVRGRFKTGGKALHAASARAAESRPVFGKAQTEEKSNEITAIPALLEKLAPEAAS
jgi:hypothetical protein